MMNEYEVIPRLLITTKKQKRPFDLIMVAEDIEWLSKHLGSVSNVANTIGISSGMLNKFLSVRMLSPKAKKFVKQRLIDSVELVNKLARFSHDDQDEISEYIVNGKLDSREIRLLAPLRKQFPKHSIDELINKLKTSENRKVSVIQFPIELLQKDIESVRQVLNDIIGFSELVSLSVDEHQGYIKVTPAGEKVLRSAARQQKRTLPEFTFTLLQ